MVCNFSSGPTDDALQHYLTASSQWQVVMGVVPGKTYEQFFMSNNSNILFGLSIL